MRLPRVIHRAWAWLGNYFWIPCPLCGREFGGHEWQTGASIPAPGGEPYMGIAVCPECAPGLGPERQNHVIWTNLDEVELPPRNGEEAG